MCEPNLDKAKFVIMLYGIPGLGKSTAAERIQRSLARIAFGGMTDEGSEGSEA